MAHVLAGAGAGAGGSSRQVGSGHSHPTSGARRVAVAYHDEYGVWDGLAPQLRAHLPLHNLTWCVRACAGRHVRILTWCSLERHPPLVPLLVLWLWLAVLEA